MPVCHHVGLVPYGKHFNYGVRRTKTMSRVTLGDVSLRGISLAHYPDLDALRKDYFQAIPQMC